MYKMKGLFVLFVSSVSEIVCTLTKTIDIITFILHNLVELVD